MTSARTPDLVASQFGRANPPDEPGFRRCLWLAVGCWWGQRCLDPFDFAQGRLLLDMTRGLDLSVVILAFLTKHGV